MTAPGTHSRPAKHPYHLVDPSPWPLLGALAGGVLATGIVLFMHDITPLAAAGRRGCMVLTMMFVWWRDVVRESERRAPHAGRALGLRYGMRCSSPPR